MIAVCTRKVFYCDKNNFMYNYSFIPNRRGSPFINFRPICHFPRPLFHIPRLLIFGRIAASPVYHMYSVNLMHIFGIGSRKFRTFDGESDRESESANESLSCRFSARVIPRPLPPPLPYTNVTVLHFPPPPSPDGWCKLK